MLAMTRLLRTLATIFLYLSFLALLSPAQKHSRNSGETDKRDDRSQPAEDGAGDPLGLLALQGQFIVNLSNDAGDGVCDATCTLRDAINGANAAPLTVNSISFASGISHIILAGEIVIGSLSDLRISGPGADLLTIDGGPGTNRIFSSTANLTIRNVTLTGGNGTGVDSSGQGGAIHVGFSNVSSLTLDRVSVTGNLATAGGGIYVSISPLHITNSSISGNNADGCGGGLYVVQSNPFAIANTTISGNHSAGSGGGLCLSTGSFGALRNVTITANTAATYGGGIHFTSVSVPPATLSLGNTIVANNEGVVASDEILISGANIVSSGNNLVGASSGDSTDTGESITYQSTDIRDTSPLLGPLQNYGGPTRSHTLLVGSPAIDAGNNNNAVDPFGGYPTLLKDQRGDIFSRKADGNNDGISTVDIGAVEAQDSFIWLGGISNDFNTGSNWDRGSVPGINDDATITGLRDPVITSGFQSIGGIKLLNGRKIYVGSNLLLIYGTLDLANGGITDNQFQVSIMTPLANAVTGGGPVHFIEGPGAFYRSVSSGNSYLFPIGIDGVYSAVRFTNIVAQEGQFPAPGIAATPHSGSYTATANGLPTNRLQRWWTLTKQAVDQADITFTYDQNDVVGNESRYKAFRIENGEAIALPTEIDTVNHTATVTGVTQFSDWTLAEMPPTAAPVSISGRIVTAAGRGIASARVTMTDILGNTRSAYTGSLGYFRFDDVPSGQSYVVSVSARRYIFQESSRVINLNDNLTGFDFTASH
jgi:predicted outer membrane repeat protein